MENEIQKTVLVTGFGPFGVYEENPSWEAVKLLPKLFDTWEKSSNINLVVEEIPVAYKNVTAKAKELWEKYKPSLIIHVGVSYAANCLTIERQANSKGYVRPDIFDKCPEEECIGHTTLQTNCNIEKICELVNENSDDKSCRACVSDDAGRYLCEYIYYQSLSIGEPQVIFVHVPDTKTYPTEKTAKGLFEILKNLIECAVKEK